MKKLDLIDHNFGKLKVISYLHINRGRTFSKCQCKCGNYINVLGTRLTSGNTKSCGCLRNEKLIDRRKTHGSRKTKEYNTWCHIKARCFNKKHMQFKDYGGRGITVCSEWKNSFIKFLNDIGKAPSSKHSIDRINNNGDYEPKNCKWSTYKEQNSNKRTKRNVTINGITKSLQDWCDEYHINRGTLKYRLDKNWSHDKIFK